MIAVDLPVVKRYLSAYKAEPTHVRAAALALMVEDLVLELEVLRQKVVAKGVSESTTQKLP